jgi:hypothetical protein
MILPDVDNLIFAELSSKDLSIACRVSRGWNNMIMKVSGVRSIRPDLFIDGTGVKIANILELIRAGEYHLLSRLKYKYFQEQMLFCICEKNDVDLFNLIYPKIRFIPSYLVLDRILYHDNSYMFDKIVSTNGKDLNMYALPQICGRNRINIMLYIKLECPMTMCMYCGKYAIDHN